MLGRQHVHILCTHEDRAQMAHVLRLSANILRDTEDYAISDHWILRLMHRASHQLL